MEKGAGTGKELELYRLLIDRKKEKKGSASEYMKREERKDFLEVAEGIVKVAVPERFKKKKVGKWKLGTSLCWLTWGVTKGGHGECSKGGWSNNALNPRKAEKPFRITQR